MTDTKLSGRPWRFRHCPTCHEETALLLSTSDDRAECLACWQTSFPGDRPTDGDVVWSGAPSTMVDFWLS